MENIKDYMPESPDFNQERLDKLKELFPDLFTSENKLNTEELKKLVEPDSISETERYEFRWFGKSNAKRNAFTPSNATLIYDEERSVNPAESENLIIEGENLEVLKLLSASYREKIKCIYIDPPYNTGKDFVYSDNFTQDKKAYWEDAGIVEDGLKIDTNTETNGRYHSNWLNMMYSRLLVARQLLREDGVIFISIDDNEVHHLRKLAEDVFGENNFVANIIWEKKFAPQNDAKWFSQNHDFIVCISKNKSQWFPNLLERSAELNERYKNLDNDPRGDWTSGDLLRKDFQKSGSYIITAPSGKKHSPPTGRSWRFSEQKFNELLDQDRVWFGESGENVPRIKRFLTDVQDGMKVTTIWKFSEVGHNQEATQELRTIFEGDAFFDTPKPVKLIDRLLKIATSPEDTILDFFSGSGTTGQAVMELNQEDGGNRKFILVQLPEKTDDKSEAYKAGYKKISDITIERNKRVVEKIIAAKKTEQPDLFTEENREESLKGLGFKVFKLAKSNFPRVDFAPDLTKTDAENVELLKKYIAEKEAQLVNAFNREELLTEILLKKGFNLNYSTELQAQFTKNEILLASDGEKETLICLDVAIADETVEYFKTHTSQKFICLERALDTTKKYNLKHYLGDLVDVF
ncbi:site-specific DNA-methyltransferase [Epilithonimonas hominis]|uniref:site-specific DNA-methyltransferase n=2 Tax=Epilithonimonas hominis TaxID=420404 RepID=UPI00289E0F6D|nr:DNA methyltransferase [Epilithonimonas hominis]